MDDKNLNRIVKIMSLSSYLLILFALIIIINTNPSEGYELSIYWVYPIYFWMLIILIIIMGIVLLGISFTSKQKIYFYYGIGPIILAYLIFLLIPLIRGYYLPLQSSHDGMSHL